MQNRVPTSDGRDAFIRSKPIGGPGGLRPTTVYFGDSE
jgi:hypothetical protein